MKPDRLKLLPPGTRLEDVPANWQGLTWAEWEQVRLDDIFAEAEKDRQRRREEERKKAKPPAPEAAEPDLFTAEPAAAPAEPVIIEADEEEWDPHAATQSEPGKAL